MSDPTPPDSRSFMPGALASASLRFLVVFCNSFVSTATALNAERLRRLTPVDTTVTSSNCWVSGLIVMFCLTRCPSEQRHRFLYGFIADSRHHQRIVSRGRTHMIDTFLIGYSPMTGSFQVDRRKSPPLLFSVDMTLPEIIVFPASAHRWKRRTPTGRTRIDLIWLFSILNDC